MPERVAMSAGDAKLAPLTPTLHTSAAEFIHLTAITLHNLICAQNIAVKNLERFRCLVPNVKWPLARYYILLLGQVTQRE